MIETEITTIRPAGRGIRLGLGEIWKYRELLYFLTLRDIKVRYKQTFIGIAWAVLQPVVTTAIFSVIFSSFSRFDTGTVPYPLFALSGLSVWLFVHTSVTMASGSFVANTNLVTKVYFPRLIVPFAAVLGGLPDMLVGLVLLGILMAWYGIGVGARIVAVPIFVLMAAITALSLGSLFAALNVRFRDVKFALPFLLQVWMIASPIFYPASLVGGKWKYVFALNPLTGILDGFRSALFGTDFDWQLIGISAASMLVITGISIVVFRWMEDDFADLI